MKKSTKVLSALSIISCLIGVGMMTAGAMMGGLDDLDDIFIRYNDESRAVPGDPASDSNESVTIQSNDVVYSDQDQGAAAEFTDIRGLEIDIIGDSRIEVIQEAPENMPQNMIRIFRSGGDKVSYQFEIEGSTLDIKLPREWQEYIKRDKRGVEDLTIYIPQSYQFDFVEINCVSGDFFADAIFARELSVDIVSGTVMIEDGSIDEIDIDCVSGTITCYALVNREADVDCTSGDVDITMARSFSDYDYEWEGLSGTIVLDGQEMERDNGFNKKQKINNNTGRSVDLQCISGTINVNLTNES